MLRSEDQDWNNRSLPWGQGGPKEGRDDAKETKEGTSKGDKGQEAKEPDGVMGEDDKGSKMSALGMGGGPNTARVICQGDIEEQGKRNQAEARKGHREEIKDRDDVVDKDRCAPPPNCYGEKDCLEEIGGKEEKDPKISALGVGGWSEVARSISQGDKKEQGEMGQEEASQSKGNRVRNIGGVEMDWCAPTPNCLREGGKSLPKRGGKGEGVTQKIRRWEGERETDNGIGKESGGS